MIKYVLQMYIDFFQMERVKKVHNCQENFVRQTRITVNTVLIIVPVFNFFGTQLSSDKIDPVINTNKISVD